MRCKFIIFLSCILSNLAIAQTDYDQLSNWYFHPDKAVNIIGNFDLDIAIVNSDLTIDSTISFINNSETNTGIDVFWVHPTQLSTPPTTPTTVPLNDQPYSLISPTILTQGGLLSKYGRFFAPRYRQASPVSFLDPNYLESERAAAIIEAYKDVKAAFEHYLNNHNNGNKIILAGHSQGSFHLGLLLRDLFDNNPTLRSKLIMASLGGMAYFHAENGLYSGGQWENIPLCTTSDQCQCIHNWRSFKESQLIPNIANTLPVFNSVLVDSGLVYRNVNLSNDWFVHDSLFYNTTSSPLRYYIVPDANYNLGNGANYIAFDSLYTARFKRESATKAILAVDYTSNVNDQRPNDLLSEESSPTFLAQGFHNKDYHIYLWALMQQIDAKVNGCSAISMIEPLTKDEDSFSVFPNPNNGSFTIEMNNTIAQDGYILISDISGRILQKIRPKQKNVVHIDTAGVYIISTENETKRIIIR